MEKNSVYDIGPVSPDGEIRETRLAAAAGQVLVKIPRQGEVRGGKGCGDWGEVKVSEERGGGGGEPLITLTCGQ